MNFTKSIKEYDFGDLIPIEEWIEDVKYELFTDYDGCGNFVKDGMMTDTYDDDVCNIKLCEELYSKGEITHVLWFNK
jgi:hypothetical protein